MNEKSFIARFFLWKRFSSFTYLNITQLLVVLNDSIFRLLVAFSLIDKLGSQNSSTILFISGVVFVTPFLIFSMPAGELADRCSKKKVIAWSLVAEILGMGYGIFAMHFESVTNSYIALFVVALQASVFNPAKYAILPEIAKREEISKVNGIMTLSTYLSIILGTFLASFFTQVTGRNYTLVAVFCLCVAVLGLYTSIQIETTPAKNPTKKINPLFLVQVYKSLKLAKQYPHLLLALLASSYFVYTASYTQLNLIPFGLQSLHITDVQAGYVFLAAALGIGIGSAIVAIISGKSVELGIAIIGGLGTAFSYIVLYLFAQNIWIAVFMILSLGINGGLFIVPLDAYIQIASPDKDRGEIVAAGSFLGFVGVLLSALSIGFFSDLLKMSAAQGYLVIGLTSLVVAVTVTLMLPDYFTRFIAVTFFRLFYHITPRGQPELGFYDCAFICARRYSFSHILVLLQLYPRIAFVRFVKKKPNVLLGPIYRLFHITPYPVEVPEEESNKYLEKIYNKQMPVCLFLEGSFKFKTDKKYEEVAQNLIKQNNKMTIPLVIKKSPTYSSSNPLFNLFKFLPVNVEAIFGPKCDEHCEYSKSLRLIADLEKSNAVST